VRGALELREAGCRHLLPDERERRHALRDAARLDVQAAATRAGVRWRATQLLRRVRRRVLGGMTP